ncbi:MAG: universal stress protein [Saprospiraceae bacterium]
MQHILLATDLEPTAANVAAFALAIADNFKAKLTVYHAFGKPTLTMGDDSDEVKSERVQNHLEKFIGDIRGTTLTDVIVDYKTDIDYPGDGIIDEIENGDYDLLVIGLREAKAGGEQFSSLAYRLIREADTSVLAIPPQADFQGIQEIVFATDLDHADEVVLEQLQEWRQNMVADLFVVNVHEDEKEADAARTIMSKWRERYASRPNMHFELMEGDFESDIGAYVKQRGADMLVMQSHKRGFFQRLFTHSSAADVAHVIEVPLLVMRGED